MNEAEIAASKYRCQADGCMRHPATGDTIIRTSPKGQPFAGLCAEEHYQGPDDPVIAGIEHALIGRVTTDTGWRQLRGDGSVSMSDPPAAAEKPCARCGRPRAECRTSGQPFLSCCSGCAANDGDTHGPGAAGLTVCG